MHLSNNIILEWRAHEKKTEENRVLLHLRTSSKKIIKDEKSMSLLLKIAPNTTYDELRATLPLRVVTIHLWNHIKFCSVCSPTYMPNDELRHDIETR